MGSKIILSAEQTFLNDSELGKHAIIVSYSDATSFVLLCDSKEDSDKLYPKLMNSRGIEIGNPAEFIKSLLNK